MTVEPTTPRLPLGTLPRLPAPRRVAALVALAGVVVTGALMADGAALHHTFLVPGSKHLLPRDLLGPLGAGLGLTGVQFLWLFGVMSACYAAVLAFAKQIRPAWVIGAIVVLTTLFALAPPLLSKDIFSYLAYARMDGVHGVDPYLHGPSVLPHDPVYRYVGWKHVPSAYGPLFTLMSAALAPLGVAAALWGMKIVAGLSSLGCAALVYRLARARGIASPLRAAAMFALNPLVLVWAVGGGHNDLLMLMLLLAGVLLCVERRPASGAAVAVASVFVKASSVLVLPFMLLGTRPRLRVVAGGAAALAALTGLAAATFPDHALGEISVLRNETKFISDTSVPQQIARLFGAPAVSPLATRVCQALLVAGLAFLAYRVWRRGMDWVAASGWALSLALITTTWLLAWYAIWPLAFAAVSRDRRLKAVALGLCVYYMGTRWNMFTGPHAG